uniref:HSF-type DNA-binding domain-containing protein n=2 Tax=Pseudo-nitzschia australis TaxID=44445 RepID=A0A7S4AD44_9STRA|mmetsp:Transcript_16603/g.36174  ORF Transcript_16603/g.36174 Transcript_16603/m.36174 type:complete len:468 (+) Transcript_16603:51-1454(+)
MLSHLKSRDLAPAPTEQSRQEPYADAVKNNEAIDVEQQATCAALCCLANGRTPTSSAPVPAPASVATPSVPLTLPAQPLLMHGFHPQSAMKAMARTSSTATTVLVHPQAATIPITKSVNATTANSSTGTTSTSNSKASKIKACPKQHQLPLFLSKTYHMIDQCNQDVATWSATGDNFVVKNVEKFASDVLPKYFKHSNFSSFARQLNFYGFRKLRSDPILTNDVDPQTAAFVRFYHEKFQKDRPELLHNIKRATKSDQQSKDDVDDLKSQVFKLKKCVLDMSTQMERRISELNYDYTRKISGLTAEYENLAALVTQLLHQRHHQHLPATYASQLSSSHHVISPSPPFGDPSTLPQMSSATTSFNTNGSGVLSAKIANVSSSSTIGTTSSSSLSSNTTAIPSHTGSSASMGQQEKMLSLSQVAAMNLIGNAGRIPPFADVLTTNKRAASESISSSESEQPSAIRQKTI